MAKRSDMSKPVTRGELLEELQASEIRLEAKLEAKLEQKLEQKLEEKLDAKLDAKLANYATKADLEIWGGALAARTSALETRVDLGFRELSTRIDGLYGELARHTRAILESMSTQISAVDDKYADLPGRVSRLERDAARPRRR